MYRAQFFNLLRKELPRAVLLFGEDTFYIEESIKVYIKSSQNGEVFRYYFDEYNFEAIKATLSQGSLFGDTNLILIKRDKIVPKAEMEKLIELSLKSQNSYLVFHFLGTYSNIKPLLGLFNIKNRAVWVRFFKPTLEEMVYALEDRARALGLYIDRENVLKLITILDGNLEFAIKELEKFVLLNREITSKDIDNLVYSATPLVVDEFLTKLFFGKNIVFTLKRLLEFGEDEFSIIASVQNFLYQINLFKLYSTLYGRVDVGEILGYRLPPSIEKRRVEISSLLTFEKLSKLFKLLIEMELNLKNSSAVSREGILFTGFIRFQKIIY